MIKMSLQTLLSGSRGTVPSPEQVSGILTSAIRHLDDTIRSDLLAFLPMGKLRYLSPDQLRDHIQRHESEWEIISSRCTQGATVIFSLLDPSKKNLWVVNLGDSQAGAPPIAIFHRHRLLTVHRQYSEKRRRGNGRARPSTRCTTATTRSNASASSASTPASSPVSRTTGSLAISHPRVVSTHPFFFSPSDTDRP